MQDFGNMGILIERKHILCFIDRYLHMRLFQAVVKAVGYVKQSIIRKAANLCDGIEAEH
jgi:hypothetical protein